MNTSAYFHVFPFEKYAAKFLDTTNKETLKVHFIPVYVPSFYSLLVISVCECHIDLRTL